MTSSRAVRGANHTAATHGGDPGAADDAARPGAAGSPRRVTETARERPDEAGRAANALDVRLEKVQERPGVLSAPTGGRRTRRASAGRQHGVGERPRGAGARPLDGHCH